MQIRSQTYWGIAIILIGVALLLGNIFDIDFGVYCWPTFLILLGVWLLVKPQMTDPDTTLTQKFIGDVYRSGDWEVNDEEFWAFVLDYDLDFTKAMIPKGETRLRANAFVNEFDVIVPENVGVSVTATGFVSTLKVNGEEREAILSPVKWETADFATAERRIRLEVNSFVSEITVRII